MLIKHTESFTPVVKLFSLKYRKWLHPTMVICLVSLTHALVKIYFLKAVSELTDRAIIPLATKCSSRVCCSFYKADSVIQTTLWPNQAHSRHFLKEYTLLEVPGLFKIMEPYYSWTVITFEIAYELNNLHFPCTFALWLGKCMKNNELFLTTWFSPSRRNQCMAD